MTDQFLLRVLLASAVIVGAVSMPCSPAGAVDDGYSPPVAAPIADPFRPPDRFGGPGNRGLEYRTRPGQAVTASGAGRVAFAGSVASRLVVAIDHPDGLRTTYSGLEDILVSKGQVVERGERIGSAGARFHFGVRAGSAYLDPSLLFEASHGHVRLVPVAWLRSG
jgi:murein DD-endopeptidase MepM/ murein hydrolase activator NlpD